MARQEIMDNTGWMFGWIEEINGKLFICDRSGRQLGFYDPKNNSTHKMTGVQIGYGNILTTYCRWLENE